MARRTDIDWRACIRHRLAGTAPRHEREAWLIPGLTAEQTRPLLELLPSDPAPAAVLVPLVERDEGLTVLLTQRATQLKNHAGQISFPGGRIEPHDGGPVGAALREAREEIGLEAHFVEVAGFLPDHVVTSGFRVTPVVGFVRPGFELRLNAREVDDIFEVPLDFIFEPANHRVRRRRLPGSDVELDLYDIPYGERYIWGATAGMLLTLYRTCTQESER
ncbi:MAG: CoA pyrophosphatase [Pseudomonadota bacterium]